MRITAGKARGMKLFSPKGMQTRPMIERVKQAMFNIIGDIEGDAVLDLFAGSGALGLEAISRGAASCYFVENHPTTLAALQKNIAKAGFQEQVEVLTQDAFQIFPKLQNRKFRLFFLDPPYRYLDHPVSRAKFLDFLTNFALYAEPDAVLVLHYRAGKIAGMPMPAPLRQWDQRRYGTSELSFLEFQSRS